MTDARGASGNPTVIASPNPAGPLPPAMDPRRLPGDPRDNPVRGNLVAYLPFALVLAVATVGVCYSTIVPEHWLRGVLVVASALGLAAVLRLVMPSRQVGLLAVRSRAFDVVCFVVLAAAIVGFGVGLPG